MRTGRKDAAPTESRRNADQVDNEPMSKREGTPRGAIDLAHEAAFELGGLRISPSSREVSAGDARKSVEPRVMQALICLARAQGAVVSRDDLVRSCWDGRIVGEDAINRCIAKVRRLADDGQHFSIETIARVGYRLSAAPRPSGESAAEPSAGTSDASLSERVIASSGLHARDDVRRDLVQKLAGEEAHSEEATIFFADMKGFTRLSRALAGNPQAIQTHLTELVGLLADSVLLHNGIVNKFLGDGVMAFFRGSDGPLHAVQCAFDIREKFAALKESWSRGFSEEIDFLEVGMGIAYGNVMIGAVGDGKVSECTIIGNPVSIAAALENRARDGRFILCENRAFHAIEPWIVESEGPLKFQTGAPGGDQASHRIYHIKAIRRSAGRE